MLLVSVAPFLAATWFPTTVRGYYVSFIISGIENTSFLIGPAESLNLSLIVMVQITGSPMPSHYAWRQSLGSKTDT
jgi:hypothetical protein